MDDFTLSHLHNYAIEYVCDDELRPFVDWVLAQSADDLEYYYTAGWPVALANFRKGL